MAQATTALMCAAALVGASPAFADTVGSLDVLHTNDTHGRYGVTYYADADDEGTAINCFSALKQLSDEVGTDLILDAGDTFHGASFATISEGESIARLMDAAGLVATTPGNHDWSYGASRLAQIDADHDFSVLAANVVDAQTGEPYFDEPYLLRTVDLEDAEGNPNGEQIQVGIFGVTDESFYTSTPSYNVEGLTFADPVATAAATAAELRAKGADIVICLTHNEDPEGFAAAVSGVDVVVAGHEHIAIDQTVTAADGRSVAVVESPSSPSADYFGSIGVLTLTIDQDDEGAYTVSAHTDRQQATADASFVEADPDIAALTDEIVAEEGEILNEAVGTSSEAYPYSLEDQPGGWELVRTEDTPIGHVVTGSYLVMTGADLAFENAGGIRGGVPAGTVTAGDLVSISPYGNTLSTYRLTGDQIKDALESSVDILANCRNILNQQIELIEQGEDPLVLSWPDNSGQVLVVGGATITVDLSAPAGERVVSVEVGGQPLDPERSYVVAMNSYLPDCTDEYPMFADMELVQEWGTCEQALRALVSTDGWEQKMEGLVGSVSYLDSIDEPETAPEPEQPAADSVTEGGQQTTDQDQVTDATGEKPATAGDAEAMPQTGDGAGIIALVAAAGALCTGVGAALVVRGKKVA